MKKYFRLLTIPSLVIILNSCTSLTNNAINKILLPPLEIGKATSLINYDPVYYSMDYYISKHSWPTSKEELNKHVLNKKHKINFEQYKYFSIEQCSPTRINIHYIIKNIELKDQSIKDIKGIIGIYIENEKTVKTHLSENKNIICSITISKNPYSTTQNSITSDGYSVHNYVEYDLNSNNGSISENNYPMIKF